MKFHSREIAEAIPLKLFILPLQKCNPIESLRKYNSTAQLFIEMNRIHIVHWCTGITTVTTSTRAPVTSTTGEVYFSLDEIINQSEQKVNAAAHFQFRRKICALSQPNLISFVLL